MSRKAKPIESREEILKYLRSEHQRVSERIERLKARGLFYNTARIQKNQLTNIINDIEGTVYYL